MINKLNAVLCAFLRQRPGAIRFRAGTSRRGEGGTIHHADTITVHPQYDYVIADYDIAFVTVKEPFEFTESVQAIPLATSEPQDGDVALISGWGVEHVSKVKGSAAEVTA